MLRTGLHRMRTMADAAGMHVLALRVEGTGSHEICGKFSRLEEEQSGEVAASGRPPTPSG